MAISTIGKMANKRNNLNKCASFFELYATKFTYNLFWCCVCYDTGTK
jgi:hypothetical protein